MHAKLKKYAKELSQLSNSQLELDLFELELEEEWSERAIAVWELFVDSPDQLLWWAESELKELRWLEEFFREREDYEKCAVLVRIQRDWSLEFGVAGVENK